MPVPRARPEDPLSGCPSADPSPKKQKTCAAPISPQGSSRSKRSRLEEQLACSAAELRYIDSQSPENQQVALTQSLGCVCFVNLWLSGVKKVNDELHNLHSWPVIIRVLRPMAKRY